MKRIKIVSAIFLSFVLFGSTLFVFGENILKNIQVTYRNITIHINGKIVPSEQEPFVYQGRAFVPLRTIGDAFNKKIEWDNAKNIINITEPGSEIIRLESLNSLLNYFPDNYTISKSEEKLTMDELSKLQEFVKKVITSNKWDIKVPDFSKERSRGFLLDKNGEKMNVFYISSNIVIRYQDKSLYFLNFYSDNLLALGASDGWFMQHESPGNIDQNERYYNGYLNYINISILFDKPNRTEKITDLYVTHLWIVKRGLYKNFYE